MDQTTHEMISAFAIGCMDKDNYLMFKKYIEEGGELPAGELGELQNVISLLPTILEQEAPDPALKDEVAKKLLSLRAEIKSKIKETKRTTTEQPKEPPLEATEERSPIPAMKIEQPVKEEHQPNHELKEVSESVVHSKNNSRMELNIFWGVCSILFIAILVIFYMLNGKIDSQREEINSLKEEIKKVEKDLRLNSEFTDNYSKLIEFINYPEITMANLTGGSVSSKANGKIWYSPSSGETMLIVNKLPALNIDDTYQLWIVTKSKSFSIGSFTDIIAGKYISFKNGPMLDPKSIEMIRITKEKQPGAEIPQGSTYLFGSFYN